MQPQYSKNIAKLIADIQNQPNLNNTLIYQIVDQVSLTENDVESFYCFEHPDYQSYGRKLIFDNGNFKILLMSWKSGDYTAIHNHGYTEWGCVYYFGEATHRLYRLEEDSLRLAQKDTYYKGNVASVCGDLTHLMGNGSNKDFSTLHIYGSNSRTSDVSKDAVVYLPEFAKKVTTMGSAYLNMNQELMLSETHFNTLSKEALTDYFYLVKPYYERNKLFQILNLMENKIQNLSN